MRLAPLVGTTVLIAALGFLLAYCDQPNSSRPPDDPTLFLHLDDAVRHADIAEQVKVWDHPAEVLPDSLLMLPKLRVLEWTQGRLRIIPPFVAYLNCLETLSVDSCPLDSLPPEIGQISRLKRLGVARCRLRALPDEICALSDLLSLRLRSNQLTHLPNDIHELKQLQYLDLRENPIDSAEIERIRQALPNLTSFWY